MFNRIKTGWLSFSGSLGFIPGVIVFVFAALGIGLVELDQQLDLGDLRVIFGGDASAARTLLSVIAGSLITVAGLTFSITMVVIQLASSQFSPRTLPTFFGDRITQLTIGIYVGTFVYSILVLRAVGSFGEADFVPRLSVTVASVLGIGAVVLLVVFLHHVSQMVQVSYLTASIARQSLARADSLYPEGFGEAAYAEAGPELLEQWRSQEPGSVLPTRPGYVRRVGLDGLAEALGGSVERVAVLVCAGDFVSIETPIAEVWPPEAADRCMSELRGAIAIGNERDVSQDVDFGLRQLADTAMKGMSPGINDPLTAVTCIRYLRSILVRLVERAELESVRRFEEHEITVIARRRSFAEHLDSILQVNRYVDGDALVIGEMLDALASCARAAKACGASDRFDAIHSVAETIAEQGAEEVKNDRDREMIEAMMERFDSGAVHDGAPVHDRVR